jgi:sterol desaturase/sphingolipid hydroxylase (fatty acid hydroxylase superfamily)
MQNLNQILTPFLLGLVCLEGFLSMRSNLHDYKIKDTLANMSIALISLVPNIFLRGLTILVLVKLQEYSFFHFGTSLFVWVLLFLSSDIFHYGFHYMEHRSRFFWANHSVHHSSSSYNFSVSFRTTSINTLLRLLFEAPLCILGFDARMVVIVHTIMLAYAFFQHTEFIKKLGWLEYFLNTPSHHRVHHASDEKYLDKNFGLVLIIWDKLFGTFQPEEERPAYGLTTPIKTYNPFKIIFHEWIAITKDVNRAKSWKKKLFHVFYKPGWKSDGEKKTITAQPSEKRTNACEKCARCSPDCIARLKDLADSINFPSQQISLKIN